MNTSSQQIPLVLPEIMDGAAREHELQLTENKNPEPTRDNENSDKQ